MVTQDTVLGKDVTIPEISLKKGDVIQKGQYVSADVKLMADNGKRCRRTAQVISVN